MNRRCVQRHGRGRGGRTSDELSATYVSQFLPLSCLGARGQDFAGEESAARQTFPAAWASTTSGSSRRPAGRTTASPINRISTSVGDGWRESSRPLMVGVICSPIEPDTDGAQLGQVSARGNFEELLLCTFFDTVVLMRRSYASAVSYAGGSRC